jgi:hypothetical protein
VFLFFIFVGFIIFHGFVLRLAGHSAGARLGCPTEGLAGCCSVEEREGTFETRSGVGLHRILMRVGAFFGAMRQVGIVRHPP